MNLIRLPSPSSGAPRATSSNRSRATSGNRSRAFLALSAALATMAAAGAAVAGDPPGGANAQVAATAQALFEEARDLLKDKKYSAACPKLAESLRLDPAVGTMLYLADCYEKNGQTASAWAMFTDAVTAAQTANQPDRVLKAKLRVEKLVPKLVKLNITVGPEDASAEGLEVKRDGLVIGRALFGTAVPVDPGDHTIEVTAAGKKPWSGVASVPTKAGSVIAFVVPKLEDLPQLAPEPTATADVAPPVPTTTATTRPTAAPPPTFVVPPPPPVDTTPRTVGLVVGAVGVAGIAVGSVLGLTAKSKNDESKTAGCGPKFCPTNEGIVLTQDAKVLAIGSTIAFIISGVTLATGAGLILYPSLAKPPTAPARTATARPAPAALPSPEVVLGPGSLTVRGRF